MRLQVICPVEAANIGAARSLSTVIATGPAPCAAPNSAMAAMKGWGESGAAACGGAEAPPGSTTLVPPAELAETVKVEVV
jgi:hypothetical protein